MKKIFWFFIIIISSIVLFMYLSKIRYDTSISQLFVEQSSVYRNFAKFHKIFGTDEFLVLAVTTDKDDILNKKSLQLVSEITTHFAKDEYIDMVVSITNIQDFSIKKVSVPFFDTKFIPYPQGLLLSKPYNNINNQIKYRIFSDPFFYTGLITQDRKTTFIWLLLKPELKEQPDFTKYINDLRHQIPPQVRVSGFPLIYATIKDLVMRDAQVLFCISFLVSLLLLLAYKIPFKAIIGFLISLLVTLSSFVLYLYLSGNHLHIFSNIVPLFFFITSIPTIVHMNYSKEKITRTICFLSTTTTALSIFTLYFSDIGPLSLLGIEIPFVMFISLAVNIHFSSPQDIPPKKRKITKHYNKHLLVVFAVILGFPWALFCSPPRILPGFIEYLPRNHAVVKDFDYVSKKLKAQHPFEIMIKFNEKNALVNPDVYIHLQNMENEIISNSEKSIAETISAVTLMSSLNWKFEYHINGDTNNKNFQVTRKATQFAISWLVKPFFVFFKQPQNDKNHDILSYYRSQMQQLFSSEGKYTRIGCRLLHDDPQIVLNLEKNLQKVFQKYERILNAHIYCTGYTLLIANTATNIYHTQYISILWGSALIAILFFVVMKSLALMLLAMAVNIISLTGVASVFFICGFDITLYSVILFAGLIGIMVDDTIHFVLHYNYYCKHHQDFDNSTCLENTLSHVKPAIFSSSLILLGGFCAFFVSELSVYHSFALLFQVGIVFAFFWDCYILPELIHFVKIKKTRKHLR
ncbi:RND family transporter [Candidatus Uabimicrobium sp. HlEnr_7]|uniref:efflux RND transporter permease subunit n=1 Tax=Candidatus Uabimicrobium helgolandensis TaxID=3095367 RepID=UPI003556F53C